MATESKPRQRRYAAVAAVLALVAVGLAIAAGGAPPKPLVIDVTGGPSAIVLDRGRVWVATPRAGSVTALDARTGDVAVPPLRVGGAPSRLALGVSGLWIADAAAGTVVPALLRPLQTLDPLTAGADASDIVLAGGALWVASSADGYVYVLEPGGSPTALRAGGSPVALATDGRRVVAADSRGGALIVFDAAARRPSGSPLAVGGAPVDVAVAGSVAWVADAAGGRVMAVDLRSGRVTQRVSVGRRPVALATAGEDVYVLSDGQLLRVRDGAVRSRRDAGEDPAALAVDRRYVWVASAGSDEVWRFDR